MATRPIHISVNKPESADDGFTLIELLVCLVIISLMTAAVILTISPEDDPVEQASTVFMTRINSAAQQSIITGVPAAFGVTETEYGIYSFEDGLWTLTGSANFPDDVAVTFTKDAVAIKLPDALSPLAVFEPTGLGPNFTLVLQGPERRYEMQSAGDGRVSLAEPRL